VLIEAHRRYRAVVRTMARAEEATWALDRYLVLKKMVLALLATGWHAYVGVSSKSRVSTFGVVAPSTMKCCYREAKWCIVVCRRRLVMKTLTSSCWLSGRVAKNRYRREMLANVSAWPYGVVATVLLLLFNSISALSRMKRKFIIAVDRYMGGIVAR